VGIAITVLNITISLGKQYLNNGKHVSFTDTIKEVIKKELQPNKEGAVHTENIQLNIPENLKASIKQEDKQDK